jgi:hypothetical protein
MTRKYEAVEAPTNTVEAKQAAIDYWVKRHRECVEALGISVTRLTQMGVAIPEVEINPEQLRMEIL